MSDLPAFLAPVLDDLSSLRSSTARRLRALRAVDGLLATLCLPKPAEPTADRLERERIGHVFIGLQDSVAWNVVSRLTPLAGRLLPILHSQLLNHAPAHEVETTVAELSAAFLVVQGLALLHPASKDLVGSTRANMEMILDLLLLTRHLPPDLPVFPSLAPPSDPSSASAPAPPPTSTQPPPPLAAVLLDTLFCLLVGAPKAVQAFEDAGGLDIVRKVLKSRTVVKEVRIKCLEFLLFYLMPEGSDDPAASLASLLPATAAPSPNPSAASPLLSQHPHRPASPSPRLPPPSAHLETDGRAPSPASSRPANTPSSAASTPRGTPSRAGHRRSDSAASTPTFTPSAAAANRQKVVPPLVLADGPSAPPPADASPARRPRSRQTTTRETEAELAALISRVRATPVRAASVSGAGAGAGGRMRPGPSPAPGASQSAAAVPLARRPAGERASYNAPASTTGIGYTPPRTPSRRDHAPASSSTATPTRASGTGSPSPRLRRTSSSSSRAPSPASTAHPAAPAAAAHARSRQALIDAFLLTPQKPTHARDVFDAPTTGAGGSGPADGRTPSRYRLADDHDDDRPARPPSSASARPAALVASRPTPRRPSASAVHAAVDGGAHAHHPHARQPGLYPSPKAQAVDPRANGPMLPPPYVPSHARRASSSSSSAAASLPGGLRASRAAGLARAKPAHSSTPVEATLAGSGGRQALRSSFFDPLPLPARDAAARQSPAASHASLPPSAAAAGELASGQQHPSPLLPAAPRTSSTSSSASSSAEGASPALTFASSSARSTPTAPSPDPFASRPLPCNAASSSTSVAGAAAHPTSPHSRDRLLRASAALLGDVQAFVLAPTTVKGSGAGVNGTGDAHLSAGRASPNRGRGVRADDVEGPARTGLVGLLESRQGGFGLGFGL